LIVDHEALAAAQAVNDALGAHRPFAPWCVTAADIV
jgi:hypothetical protein